LYADNVLQILGCSPGRMSSTLRLDWNAANTLFENLGDPFHEYQFTGPDGTFHSLSTAELLKIDKVSWIAARGEVSQILTELLEGGFLSREPVQPLLAQPRGFTSPQGVTEPILQGFDSRFASPGDILGVFPFTKDIFHGDSPPGAVLPRNFKPVYVTQKMVDITQFTDDMANSFIDRSVRAINSLHNAANSNPAFSPAVYMATTPSDFSRVYEFNSFLSNRYFGEMRSRVTWEIGPTYNTNKLWSDILYSARQRPEGRDAMERATSRSSLVSDRNLIEFPIDNAWCRAFYINPGNSVLNTINNAGVAEPFKILWRESLRTRQKKAVYADGIRPDGCMKLADALFDLAALFQLLSFLEECPPHALLQSTMQWHSCMLMSSLAYMDQSTFGLDTDQTWEAYTTKIEQNRALQLGLTDRVAGAVGRGIVGFIATGFGLINGETDPTLPNAVSQVQNGQQPKALLIGAANDLINFSSQSHGYERATWNDTLAYWNSHGQLSDCTYLWGYSPMTVVHGSPVKDCR